MLGKNQAKILLRYYVKLSNHLISLHKPPFCFTLPTLLALVSFVILVIVVESPKTSSFF